jgi:hypothetical protein
MSLSSIDGPYRISSASTINICIPVCCAQHKRSLGLSAIGLEMLPLAWKCCHCLDVMMGVGLDAVDPVVRDVLADEVVAAFVVGLCAEEAGDGGEVRCVAGRAGGA